MISAELVGRRGEGGIAGHLRDLAQLADHDVVVMGGNDVVGEAVIADVAGVAERRKVGDRGQRPIEDRRGVGAVHGLVVVIEPERRELEPIEGLVGRLGGVLLQP